MNLGARLDERINHGDCRRIAHIVGSRLERESPYGKGET